MSDKHTPGPLYRDPKHPKIIMSAEGGYIVGSVTGNDNSGFYASEQEAEYNARLFVVAPELLTDLRDAAAQLRKYETLHRAKNTADSLEKAEVNAKLASRFEVTITKATTELISKASAPVEIILCGNDVYTSGLRWIEY